MRNIGTIAKRDISSSFSSMIAYVVMAMFLAIFGYFFFSFSIVYTRLSFQMGADPNLAKGLTQMDAIVRPLFMNMSIVMLLVVPILSMRSFSEEKKQGTIELLFTYPFKNSDIVLGKYCALLCSFLCLLIPTFIHMGMLLLCGASIPLGPLAFNYLGIFLLGASFLAFGLFASSLTENQTIAAVLSFAALLIVWLVGWAKEFIQTEWVGNFLSEISLITHYQNFVSGVIDTNDIIFYILFITFFLYLTLRVVEKRDWR